jgi:MFS family permease
MTVDAARVPFFTGIIFTIAAVAAAAGNQITGWLLRRLPCRRLVTAASLLAAVAALVFGVEPPVVVLMATAVVFGLGIGVATTAVYAETGRVVAQGARGAALGYLQTAYLWGLAVSPAIAGLLGSVSMRAVFLADGVGLVLLAGVVWTKARP